MLPTALIKILLSDEQIVWLVFEVQPHLHIYSPAFRRVHVTHPEAANQRSSLRRDV